VSHVADHGAVMETITSGHDHLEAAVNRQGQGLQARVYELQAQLASPARLQARDATERGRLVESMGTLRSQVQWCDTVSRRHTDQIAELQTCLAQARTMGLRVIIVMSVIMCISLAVGGYAVYLVRILPTIECPRDATGLPLFGLCIIPLVWEIFTLGQSLLR